MFCLQGLSFIQWMLSCQAAAISGAVGEMLFQSSEHMQTFTYQSSVFAPCRLMVTNLQSTYAWVRAEELVAVGRCFSLWRLLTEDQDVQGRHVPSSFAPSSHPSFSKSRLTLLCTSSLPWQSSVVPTPLGSHEFLLVIDCHFTVEV